MEKQQIISELEINHGYEFNKADKNVFSWLTDFASDVQEVVKSNEYQRGYEAGRAEYKATVLSLERQIEELKRALELASVDNNICYHCGC